MGSYEIAWADLAEKLENPECVSRYEKDLKGKSAKGKSSKEILEMLHEELVRGGKVYATVPCNVHHR